LAVVNGFEKNVSGMRGYRIGTDARFISTNITGLFSIDILGLSRIEHARAIVLVDNLYSRFEALAVMSMTLPGALHL
jgi:hypothetical protein